MQLTLIDFKKKPIKFNLWIGIGGYFKIKIIILQSTLLFYKIFLIDNIQLEKTLNSKYVQDQLLDLQILENWPPIFPEPTARPTDVKELTFKYFQDQLQTCRCLRTDSNYSSDQLPDLQMLKNWLQIFPKPSVRPTDV